MDLEVFVLVRMRAEARFRLKINLRYYDQASSVRIWVSNYLLNLLSTLKINFEHYFVKYRRHRSKILMRLLYSVWMDHIGFRNFQDLERSPTFQTQVCLTMNQ